ncbi:hypothetical protein CIB84_010852, partial [Bambusicola thoracicus]
VALLTEQFAKPVAYVYVCLTEAQLSAFTVVSASFHPEDGAVCIYFQISCDREKFYQIQPRVW